MSMQRTEAVHEADAACLRARREEFTSLLADAVSGNASVGFVQPLDPGSLARFWDAVTDEVARGERTVLFLERRGRVVGSVQIAPCGKANGRHRAEIQKLLVLARMRRRGLARVLMTAAEAHALRTGCWLLLLDTRAGSAAETMYRRLEWQEWGRVPDYARDPDLTLAECVFFRKRLVEAQ